MANTTFNGPVTSLNGFIGGPNPNAGVTGTSEDTQQGGNVVYSAVNATTLQIQSGPYSGNTLLATANKTVMIYTDNGASGSAVYAFSDGSAWLRVDTRVAVATS